MTSRTRQNHRSAFNGRRQPKSASRPKDIPGILEAISWLLNTPKLRWPAQSIRRARLRGLIVRYHTNWGVNRDVIVRALSYCRRHKKLPSALVLYGLGELLARSPDGPAPQAPGITKLSRRQVRQLLKVAGEIAAAQIPTSPFIETGSRDIFIIKHLTSEVFHYAESCLNHPPLPRPHLYGLHVITETFLTTYPRELGHWLTKRHPSAINQTVLAYLAKRLIFSDGANILHQRIVHTKVPILQAIAATALASNPWNDKLMTFGDLVAFVRSTGIDSSIAFDLGIASAKAICIQRQRARHRFSDAEYRLQDLIKYPEKAFGGATYASSEITRLRAELPTLRDIKDQADLAVDKLINEMAQAWPANGVSKDALLHLRHAFGANKAELETRLAQILGSGPNVMDLLDDVIADMVEMLGLDPEIDLFANSLSMSVQEFDIAREWAAKALSLRHVTDKKGVGHRTGQLLAPLAKAALKFMSTPYAAARWPLKYESALARQACSIMLALEVACGETVEERKERALLMKLAFDQAKATLCHVRNDINTDRLIDLLAINCVECMRLGYGPDQRASWISDPHLPEFVRAFAIWSDVKFVRADPAQAEEIFRRVASPTSSGDIKRSLNWAVNLLDLALATGFRNNAPDVTKRALSIWPSVYRPLRMLGENTWSRIHLTLRDALIKNGKARKQLLDDPQWTQSHCINVIKSATSIGNPPIFKAARG